MFRIFCIGFITTLFLQLLTSVLECYFIFLFVSFDSNYNENQFLTTQVVIGIFTGLIYLITPLLYILFLWKLWFLFGKVFGKKNKYRYRIEDFKELHITPANLLNTPHHMKLPNEDRIVLCHHIVTILITSLLISGFCSQFLSLRSTTPLSLGPGDFLTKESRSVFDCDGCLEYSLYYSPITHLDPVPYPNQFTYKNPTCLDSINFYTSPISSYKQEQQVTNDDVIVTYDTTF
ncbi:hypothetical protein LOD99_9425 [Oopsacas minuta]|uniref:Uncharacterized protein n=1 Tax=Oopsacas minuta TaxID=111878 RepID=A0AAV7JBR3_9METZ|nr:hypothetical protein LOD99_9425 [Oopsacas minuta]